MEEGVLTVPGIRRRFQMTCGHILKSFLGAPKLPQSRLKLKVFALIDGHHEVATPPISLPWSLSVCPRYSRMIAEVLALQANNCAALQFFC